MQRATKTRKGANLESTSRIDLLQQEQLGFEKRKKKCNGANRHVPE